DAVPVGQKTSTSIKSGGEALIASVASASVRAVLLTLKPGAASTMSACTPATRKSSSTTSTDHVRSVISFLPLALQRNSHCRFVPSPRVTLRQILHRVRKAHHLFQSPKSPPRVVARFLVKESAQFRGHEFGPLGSAPHQLSVP